MIDFARVRRVVIPESTDSNRVVKIMLGDKVLWDGSKFDTADFKYVSLGDSIASGHMINDSWENGYQYGQNGNTETTILDGTYTDLISKELRRIYGADKVSAVSYCRSGSRVSYEDGARERDLIRLLEEDERVRTSISEADLVTVCIGGNSVLGPAEEENRLVRYLTGEDVMPALETDIENILRELDIEDSEDPKFQKSYRYLLKTLNGLLKPSARVVLTTQYNPHKYLNLARGSWDNEFKDSFFAPLLDLIPQMTVAGFELDVAFKKLLLDTQVLKDLFYRINVLSAWEERYIENGGQSYRGLNPIIRDKIKAFQETNTKSTNFTCVEIKDLFDSVTNRDGAGEAHYDDLVNNQLTTGYNANMIPWENLWKEEYGTGAEARKSFWTDLIDNHSSKVLGVIVEVDYEGIANELLPKLVERIIHPMIDVHPKECGHYAMYRAFADTLGMVALKTITFNANGGEGTMSPQKVLDVVIGNGQTKKVYSITRSSLFTRSNGYYFTGWIDDLGNTYHQNQAIYVASSIKLYAMWSNEYSVTYTHSMNDRTHTHTNSDTGPMEKYEFWLDRNGDGLGELQGKLGAFSNPAKVWYAPYNTSAGVWLGSAALGDNLSKVFFNGQEVAWAKANGETNYDFQIKSNTVVEFVWNYWINTSITKPIQSHWDCYITTQ